MPGDRNFDDLAHRFGDNVYGGLKGQIRLDVIRRDLAEHVAELAGDRPLNVLDAGCGRAPYSLSLVHDGHQLTLVDISVEMLKLALADCPPDHASLRWFHGSVLQFQQTQWQGEPFDLILCHAVLEWVEEPQALLTSLTAMLRSGGALSLLFYNLDGLIYKNLLRTNFNKVRQRKFAGSRRSLTPSYPREISAVKDSCQAAGLTLVEHSGVRVFHDYIFAEQDRQRSPQELRQLELELSRSSPYRELGRYQHLLLRKL